MGQTYLLVIGAAAAAELLLLVLAGRAGVATVCLARGR